MRFIEALTEEAAQTRLVTEGRILPSRQAVLNTPLFTTEFGYEVIRQSLQRGNAFDGSYMWGLVEDRLIAFAHSIWQQVFMNPDFDLEGELNKRLSILSQRLNATLGAR